MELREREGKNCADRLSRRLHHQRFLRLRVPPPGLGSLRTLHPTP